MLLVDDDEDIRTLCELGLRRLAGWNVVLAGSGQEALAAVDHARPDVILLDVMMPGEDGLQVLERLRAREGLAKVPVIFLTAKVQTHEVERYRKLGAAGVIRKPFEVLKLPDEIRKLVEGSSPGPC